MTAAEFREAVIAAYRETAGVEPPSVRVTGDEKAGFTVTFTTTIWSRDWQPAEVVNGFRAAAGVQSGLLKTEGE